MSELPAGWAEAPLADVGTWCGGGTPSKANPAFWSDGKIPWVSPKDMKVNTIRDAEDHITDAAVAGSATNLVESGSVLMVTRSGILRHTFPVAVTARQVSLNQDLKALSPYEGLSAEYIAWALRWQGGSILRTCAKGGTTVQSVETDQLLRFRIPIAPSQEQERIVAAIEEQFSRLDAGVAALHRVAQNLKLMRAAVLQAAVSGQLLPLARGDVPIAVDQICADRRATWEEYTSKQYKEPAGPVSFPLPVPEHWRIASLEAITDPVRVICYGILMPKEHIENGVPYVRVKDMKGWAIDVPGLNRTAPEIAAKYARASLHAGDLLLAIRGSYGRVAIVPPELDGANITQDSARIAAHPAIDHRYLLYYLGGSVANRYYQRVARGVAVKGVNIGDLRAMPVPIPPWDEQVAIADEVERQFSFLDLAEGVVRAQLRRSASLRSSILAAAFAGNLASQDSGDEPAAALLDRITAEQQSSNGQGRGAAGKRRRPRKGIAA